MQEEFKIVAVLEAADISLVDLSSGAENGQGADQGKTRWVT